MDLFESFTGWKLTPGAQGLSAEFVRKNKRTAIFAQPHLISFSEKGTFSVEDKALMVRALAEYPANAPQP